MNINIWSSSLQSLSLSFFLKQSMLSVVETGLSSPDTYDSYAPFEIQHKDIGGSDSTRTSSYTTTETFTLAISKVGDCGKIHASQHS